MARLLVLIRRACEQVICVTILLCLEALGASAQPADPELLAVADEGPAGYRVRIEDHLAEGFYRQPVTSSARLEMRAIIWKSLPESWNESTVITFKRPNWVPTGVDSVWVKGACLRRDCYYSIDGLFTGEDEIDWKIGEAVQNPLNNTRLRPTDIGLYSWFRDGTNIVFGPVEFESQTAGETDIARSMELLLLVKGSPLDGFYAFVRGDSTEQELEINRSKRPVGVDELISLSIPVDFGRRLHVEFFGNVAGDPQPLVRKYLIENPAWFQ